MSEKGMQATDEELCRQVLKHYEELSNYCCSWCSSVPRAIKFYFEHRSKFVQTAALLKPVEAYGLSAPESTTIKEGA